MAKKKTRKKGVIKNTSVYRGTLITLQHYLNTYHFTLPMEETNCGNQLYNITEWYKNGILIKIEIKLKELRKESDYGKEKDKNIVVK